MSTRDSTLDTQPAAAQVVKASTVRRADILSNVAMTWKMVLIILVMSLGAIGVSLASVQGLGVMRYHLSNLYDFMLVPIVAINQADTALADAQIHLTALRQVGLTLADQAARIGDIQAIETTVAGVMTRYDTEWVTTSSPEFTAILRGLGRLDLQQDEVSTLAAYHAAYDKYLQAREAYLTSVQMGTPDDQLANQTINLLAQVRASLERLIAVNDEFAKLSNDAAVSAHRQTLLTIGLAFAITLLLGLATSYFIARSITRRLGNLTEAASALEQGRLEHSLTIAGRDEIARLSQAFSTMAARLRDLIGSLERRVAERTTELERRSGYLQASAEVGSVAASILDTDQLIQQVVELVRERFDLYYVGLFLSDEAGEWAVLRAGTGEAGRKMLARGHRLQIGSGPMIGMIGWSITNAQPRIAQIAAEDAVRLATDELPDTRSEAALPLRSRGRVIGALTVQSAEPDVFDEAAIAVLQIMTDQVAVALDNARLYAESQAALETARRAYGELSQQAWAELLRARTEWNYRYAQRTVTPTQDNLRPEMLQALQTGQSTQGDGTGEPALAVPLKVRDSVIGVLHFRKGATGTAWTPEEQALLKTLADRLAQTLESARLYQDTQRRAARERTINTVTARIRGVPTVNAILQRTVEELGRTFGASRASIRVEMSEPAGKA